MSNSQNPTIAIIDSGIGGVSVLRQLIKKFHAGNYIYYADNLYMPYGNKTKDWLKTRLNKIINELQHNYQVDYVILACNTASASIDKENYNNLITMQFQSDLPYLATTLTKKTLPNKEIIADSTLAKQIERNIFNQAKLNRVVKQHVKIHQLDKLKEFILGCTHYELIQPIFKKLCPNSKVINNSSFIIDLLKFNIQGNELNIVVKLSKQDYQINNRIFNLISSSN